MERRAELVEELSGLEFRIFMNFWGLWASVWVSCSGFRIQGFGV